MNKLIFTLFVLLIISCNTIGINKSAKIIQDIETKNYKQTYANLAPQNKEFYNMLYQDFFEDREFVNEYIKLKKIKNFILQESFNVDDASGIPLYNAFIVCEDSVFIYNYSTSKKNKNIRKKGIKEFSSGNPFFYTFDNKNYYVNKSLSNDEISLNSYYISGYTNNKLNYLAKIRNNKDSVLFKYNNNKTLVDLNTEKWFTSQGICAAKNNLIECEEVKRICIKNEQGFYTQCDTLHN